MITEIEGLLVATLVVEEEKEEVTVGKRKILVSSSPEPGNTDEVF